MKNGQAATPKATVDTRTVFRSLRKVETPQAQGTRDLNEVVHQILIIGLYVSIFFMVSGLIIDLIRNRAFPTTMLTLPEVWARLLQLRASGFFSLGLLLLILTPLLRVVGSFFVFLWERDWRYAGVTLIVLVVMLVSIWFGEG